MMQGALINHCELMRYRFAVLDGPRPPQDTLSDVQNQRQQFDTKYAALYHPWLLIPDPFPVNLGKVVDYPIPPAGHMVGIYARTDIERGVHKAPANEVVRGITGLQRMLNKERAGHPQSRIPVNSTSSAISAPTTAASASGAGASSPAIRIGSTSTSDGC